MIRVSTSIKKNAFNPAVKKINTALAALPAQGLDKFRALTPIDQGRARRSTVLVKTEIQANYPYAQRLEDNWSKQTKGLGIIGPFTRWWQAQLKRIARIK